MKKLIKTLWQGKVGVAQHEIKKMIDAHEPLIIIHDGDTMIIPYTELNARIVGTSIKEFPDKFSDKLYKLAYYKWKPDKEEATTTLEEYLANKKPPNKTPTLWESEKKVK